MSVKIEKVEKVAEELNQINQQVRKSDTSKKGKMCLWGDSSPNMIPLATPFIH
jgi:hypothetical protein